MMNRMSTRGLVTLGLAAAVGSGIGTEAQAASKLSRANPFASIGMTAPRPAPGPMSGDPDDGNHAPLPPKTGAYPTGGQLGSSWGMRILWIVRAWVGTVPKRFL